jgi:hypothetical protein
MRTGAEGTPIGGGGKSNTSKEAASLGGLVISTRLATGRSASICQTAKESKTSESKTPKGRTSRSRDAWRPSWCRKARPRNKEGAGKTGCRPHPWPACNKKKQEPVTTGSAKSSGLPCAMVLRLPARSPRGPGSLAPVIPEKLASQELSASVGAPGPHAFSVRVGIVRPHDMRAPTPPASIASAPTFRDDRP